jgi:hypothetical protein
MKTIYKLTLLFAMIFLSLFALTSCASNATLTDHRTVIGETYNLEDGRILDGNLNVIGGVVAIKETASVNGNVFVLGGLVSIDGTIKGDLTAIGGTVNLNETAVLEGDLISPVSYINVNPNALVLGDRVDDWIIPGIDLEQFTNLQPRIYTSRNVTVLSMLTRIGKAVASTLGMVTLGAFLLLIMPKPAERMSKALTSAPWQLFGFGALTAFVMANALILTITICLIPLVVLLGLVFALATLVGWLVLGYELGKRIGSSIFKTTWHPVLAAALGNLVLYLVAWGINSIPCIGWFLVFVTMLFGLGMAVTTFFGTYPYPRIASDDSDIDPVVLFQGEHTSKAEHTRDDQPIDLDLIEDLPPLETPQQTEVFVDEVVIKPEIPIEELNLGTRVDNALKDAGLTTVEDVLHRLERGDDALLEISGFGEKSLSNLKDALLRMGYGLDQN